ALWKKNLSKEEWENADASFVQGRFGTAWKKKPTLPKEWKVLLSYLTFIVRPTSFKHTGIFPEHVPNWQWIEDKIRGARRPISVLNLFGYTGGATLAAANAGASVTHVDGSKTAVTWARENASLSGLAEKPIRWIVDDVREYVSREIRRGKRYDAIVMDPPTFGHGKEGEVWKLEEDLLPLLELCRQVLSDKPLFILMNGYAAGYSALSYKNALDPFVTVFKNSPEIGELTIEEEKNSRLLPAGIFARIENK
ncbi:MAG: class I SAM-dependent methyltransferase, partial [Candidatus Paceibacterota bacterium]